MTEPLTVDKWTRVTGPERDALRAHVVAQYTEQGMSVRAISASTKRSYGAVYRLLEEGEVKLRPRGNPKVK